MNFNDVAIISVKESDYGIHFWYMNKSNPINMMKNGDLTTRGVCCNFFY